MLYKLSGPDWFVKLLQQSSLLAFSGQSLLLVYFDGGERFEYIDYIIVYIIYYLLYYYTILL